MRHEVSSMSTFKPQDFFASVNVGRNEDVSDQRVLLPSYVFSTKQLPVREQFDAYHTEFSGFGKPTLPDGVAATSGFRAERVGYVLGPLAMTLTSSDPYSFDKPVRQASSRLQD